MLEQYEEEKKRQLTEQSLYASDSDESSDDDDSINEYEGINTKEAVASNTITTQCGSATVEIADLNLSSKHFLGNNTVSLFLKLHVL